MAAANRGSLGSTSNYQRMVQTYGPPRPTGSTALLEPPAPVAPTATRTFSAEGAFNKAGLLGALALVVGALAYVADLPLGLVWPLLLVAVGAGLWASFRPQQARVLAPVFAVCEGAVLGMLSRFSPTRVSTSSRWPWSGPWPWSSACGSATGPAWSGSATGSSRSRWWPPSACWPSSWCPS